MANILVAYGSSTGNTAAVADMIGFRLKAGGHTVHVHDVAGLRAENLCDSYDAVLFGCSTWGYDEIELQPDFEILYENFSQMGAAGKPVAVFGCGDVAYPYFCGAVDQIEQQLESLDAKLITSGLKVDGDPQNMSGEVRLWADDIIKAL